MVLADNVVKLSSCGHLEVGMFLAVIAKSGVTGENPKKIG